MNKKLQLHIVWIVAGALALIVIGAFLGRWFGGAFIAKPNRSAAEVTVNAPEPGVTQLDLNTATAEELATLPGVGEKLAEEIVRFRKENGPFGSVWEISDVKGIGDVKRDAIVPYLTVEP